MKKYTSLVLAFYAFSMVFYGSLEMTHDLLHYLADHYQSTLHSHSHDHSHTVHDHEADHHNHHEHPSVSHHHETPASQEEDFPSALNFFLFIQSKADFSFTNSGCLSISLQVFPKGETVVTPPTPPPPESSFAF